MSGCHTLKLSKKIIIIIVWKYNIVTVSSQCILKVFNSFYLVCGTSIDIRNLFLDKETCGFWEGSCVIVIIQ